MKQGRQSYSKDVPTAGGCMYRSPNGDKCAIGCLIPDELYNKDIEGLSVFHDEVSDILKKIYPDATEKDLTFLSVLQDMHDDLDHDKTNNYENFRPLLHEAMQENAYRWNLKVKHFRNLT